MTLSVTSAQMRTRALSYVGTEFSERHPSPWWASTDPESSDCLAFLTWCAGLRTKADDYTLKYISIHQLLLSESWTRIPASEVRAGDWLVENWSGGTAPEHIEFCYSVAGTSRVVIAANTGPEPGRPHPRGVWKKTRPNADGKWLLFGLRPPYAPGATTATSGARARARRIATWLNDPHRLPEGCVPSSVGDIWKNGHTEPGDGITDPAPVYWTNVQTWGSLHDKNGKAVEDTSPHSIYRQPFFEKDGIPGHQSEYVEEILDHLSK